MNSSLDLHLLAKDPSCHPVPKWGEASWFTGVALWLLKKHLEALFAGRIRLASNTIMSCGLDSQVQVSRR